MQGEGRGRGILDAVIIIDRVDLSLTLPKETVLRDRLLMVVVSVFHLIQDTHFYQNAPGRSRHATS